MWDPSPHLVHEERCAHERVALRPPLVKQVAWQVEAEAMELDHAHMGEEDGPAGRRGHARMAAWVRCSRNILLHLQNHPSEPSHHCARAWGYWHRPESEETVKMWSAPWWRSQCGPCLCSSVTTCMGYE